MQIQKSEGFEMLYFQQNNYRSKITKENPVQHVKINYAPRKRAIGGRAGVKGNPIHRVAPLANIVKSAQPPYHRGY